MVGPPEGATINNSTGAFTWTPTESQDGVHTFNVTVSDGTGSDSRTFTVTVREVNSPPVLNAVSNHTIQVQSAFTLNVTATDPDMPANNLTYGMTGLPAGASFNAVTGIFTWTPDESQIGTHRITATVSDGTGSDSRTFTVTVRGANSPSSN